MTKRILALAAALGLAACSGDKGDKGDPGQPGEPGQPGPGAVATPADNLRYTIQSATLVEGQAPTVTFKVTDAAGVPITLKTGTTLAFTPTFTLARYEGNGKWTGLLTRSVTGKQYYADAAAEAAGTATNPALANATQVTSQSAAADRIAGGDGGVYTYTFSAPITGVNAAATHRVGIYGNRVVDGVTMSDSNTFDFVPAGGTPVSHEVVSDASCNKCHTVVNAHGGARRGVKLCVTCHTPQTIDPETGNTVDFLPMVHKIHKGALLANGYKIVGFMGNPAPAIGPASSVIDFGHVKMGPSHATYFELTTAGNGTITDPLGDRGIIRECARCHQGAEGNAFTTSLSAANCNSCHDDVNPGDVPLNGLAPGTKHGNPSIGGWPTTACVSCHGPGQNFMVEKVHSVNYEPSRNIEFTPNDQNKLVVTIDKVNDAISGGTVAPSVEFTITLNGQPYDVLAPVTAPAAGVAGKSLGSLGFQIAGPITDYGSVFPSDVPTPGVGSGVASGRGNASVTALGTPGKFKYTFGSTIPAGRTGVYVVAFESYFREGRVGSDNSVVSKPYAADPVFHDNPTTPADDRNVRFVNIATGADVTTVGTGSTARKTERRKIVDNSKCNNCHEDLGFHGNRSRQGVDYCATCHNPNLSNQNRARFQPSDLVTVTDDTGTVRNNVFVAESVSTNVFIHKIHMGAELSKPYALGANRTTADATPGAEGLADFSTFELPSPVANCETCHDPGTYHMPNTPNLLPVKQSILDCTTTANDTGGQPWCSSRAVVGTVTTPPIKAVCTSCHDTAAANAHADLNTVNPMRANAIETCGACHDQGKDFDAVKMHPPVLIPSVDLPETTP